MTADPRGPECVAVGFVLAGGQSSRMGTEKALVEFGGRPLIAHAVGTLQAGGLTVFIAGSHTGTQSHLDPYAPVIPDREAGLGPLGGICSGLAATTADIGLFLPVDLPLLPSSLVAYLIRRAQISNSIITLVSANGHPQTFPAVISRRTLPALEKELAEHRLGCFASFLTVCRELGEQVAILDTEVLVQSGKVVHPDALPAARWFLNLNRPQDLRRAARFGVRHVS